MRGTTKTRPVTRPVKRWPAGKKMAAGREDRNKSKSVISGYTGGESGREEWKQERKTKPVILDRRIE